VFLESRSGKNNSVTSSPHRTLTMFFRSWQGTGIHEEGIDVKSGKTIVKIDPGYFRPAEVEYVPFQQTV
jgi:GDP-D-mannose dehydratase